MTRFAFLVDSHLGGDPDNSYKQQPTYLDRQAEILGAFDEWLKEDGAVDFVLHGGDMIDCASSENMRRARELYDLSVPVHLCLGNHDMRGESGRERWLAEAPDFFPGGDVNFVIDRDDCAVVVAPAQWTDRPYEWEFDMAPHFLPEQRAFLDAALADRRDRPVVLSCHVNLWPVPPEQSGFDEPYHQPSPAFADRMREWIGGYPQAKFVLSGHNHINTHVVKDSVHYATASGFCETPFEFKLVEIDGEKIAMKTISLASRLGFRADYDYERVFVQGRERDRTFEETLDKPE